MSSPENNQIPSAPPFEPGRRVGDVELVRLIGSGCIAGNQLFLGRALASLSVEIAPGTDVAVEIMVAIANEPKAARRARARFELLATTEAEALLHYIDFKTIKDGEREIPYILTTAPRGRALAEIIGEKPDGHAWEEVKNLADVLLRTLTKLNDAGAPLPRIVPQHVYFNGERDASLINLDIVDPNDVGIKPGTNLSDFNYIAPDILSGGRGDEAEARLFSLAVCLFEYLYGAGKLPYGKFDDHTSWLAFWKSSDRSKPPRHPAETHVPRYARAFLDRCLAVDRADRYHSFNDALQALFAGETTQSSIQPTQTQTTKTRDRIVGEYELQGDEPVGLGAQGVVWKAIRIGPDKDGVKNGEIVALKILNPHVGDLSKSEERFRRLLVLRHPHIVQYKEVFIHPDGARCCIAMEFVDGDSLDKILARCRDVGLPWEQTRKIIQECLDALAYAATQNVIHRDIKPPNIHVNKDGNVKVIDFEIARRAAGASTVATVAGFAGTFAYMAPEFAGENFSGDEKSDVFSAGVCFVEVAGGGLPFDPFTSDQQSLEFMRRWMMKEKWPQPKLDHIRHPVPLEDVRAFLAKMVNPDRDQRFARFNQALADFRRFMPRVIGEEGGEKYEYDEAKDLLGKGGFGAVFKGRRIRDGLEVAIKQLHAQKYIKRFARERKILEKVKHPNIVRFVDFVELENLGQHEYFIMMEFLEGMPDYSLRRRIKRAGVPLPVAEAVALFQSYLAAVGHLHEIGVVHRDLTPNNLYAPPGRPQDAKVIDLGVAMDESGTMTVSGGLPGVPDYMAPEFATRNNVRGSPQTDLFSLGICFYEALVGRRPFPTLPSDPKRSWSEWIKRCQSLPPIDYSALAFHINPELQRIVSKVLAPEPEDRYTSAQDMSRDLEAALAALSDDDNVATQMYNGPLPTAEEAQGEPADVDIRTAALPVPAAQYAAQVPAREEAVEKAPPPKAVPVKIEKPPEPPKPPAPVIEFSAADRTIQKSGSTMLRWKIERADSATLDGEKIPLAGEREVRPSAKTRYIIVADGPGGRIDSSTTVGIAINWKPIIIGAVAAAAASVIVGVSVHLWNNRQIGYSNWSASVESVNGMLTEMKAHRPEQTTGLKSQAGAKYAEAFGAEIDKKLQSGSRHDAVLLVQQWSQVATILKSNEIAFDTAFAASLGKRIADSYTSAFTGFTQATNAAAAQALMSEWNSVTGQLAGVTTFDPAIVVNMQKQLSQFRALQESSDLLRDARAARTLGAVLTSLESYKGYRNKWGANAQIEAQYVATISNLVVTTTASYTVRPAGLSEFEQTVGELVAQKIIPPAAKSLLADAGTRIDSNQKDRDRLQRFQKLKAALAVASGAEQIDALHKQIAEGTWSPDQASALNELANTLTTSAIDVLVPAESEIDGQKLVQAQTQLRHLPDWMQKSDRFKQVDAAMTARIDSAKMADQKKSQIDQLHAAIPKPPAKAEPRAYAAFAKSIDAVVADARKQMLYPSIAADISSATNAADTALWAEMKKLVGAWDSPDRPTGLSNWVAAARAAASPDLPAWARDTLAKMTEQAENEMKQAEVVIANDSRYPVEVRWPAELARPADHIGAGSHTSLVVRSDYPLNIQAAADASAPFSARRKTAASVVVPGRRNSVTLADGQFPVLPTVVAWSGPSKDLAGVTLQIDGADFAAGQSKPVAPESAMKLQWKRPDHQDVLAAYTVAAVDRVDLAQMQPAADKWVPSEDFTVAKTFIALVAKQDMDTAASLKARCLKAVINDEGVRTSLAAAIKQYEQATAGHAEAALHAADRVRATCYLYSANNASREGRIAAAQKRLAALGSKVLSTLKSADDPRQRLWLGIAEKGAQLAPADVQNALKQIPKSSEQEADRIILTYLLDGTAAAAALPEKHPEYQRYWFHTSRLAEFLSEDIEANRIEETADLAIAFMISTPKSVVIEADDLAAVKQFVDAARAIADQQAAWVAAQAKLKKLQAALASSAGKVN